MPQDRMDVLGSVPGTSLPTACLAQIAAELAALDLDTPLPGNAWHALAPGPPGSQRQPLEILKRETSPPPSPYSSSSTAKIESATFLENEQRDNPNDLIFFPSVSRYPSTFALPFGACACVRGTSASPPPNQTPHLVRRFADDDDLAGCN